MRKFKTSWDNIEQNDEWERNVPLAVGYQITVYQFIAV